jgi:hypothetical protein
LQKVTNADADNYNVLLGGATTKSWPQKQYTE